MSKRIAVGFAFACALLLCHRAAAQSADVHVLVSNGIKAVVEDMRPQIEHAIGHPLTIEYRPTTALQKEIEAGAQFDAVIVTAESIGQMSKEGKTLGGEGTPISRVGVGIGIPKGAARPDVSTPDAVKRAMLNAKAVAYGPAGASYPYIVKMFESLGIADAMKAKTQFFDTSDGTNGALADGKVDFGFTLVSEILPFKGIELLAPFPPQFQGYVRFAGAVSANAKNPEAAAAMIKVLAGPDSVASIKARGMEPH
jgi:molybdate transport system substrate-binding protein